MSFLNATATLHHRTPLPDTVKFDDAVALLHKHEELFSLDPEFRSFTTDDPPADAKPNTKYYTVTDHMEALPAGLWDTTVQFGAAITDVPSGIEWQIKAPLGLVQFTTWTIEELEVPENGGKKGLVMVEEVEIKCSRLLVGIVRRKCEDNWRGIHSRFIEKLTAA